MLWARLQSQEWGFGKTLSSADLACRETTAIPRQAERCSTATRQQHTACIDARESAPEGVQEAP